MHNQEKGSRVAVFGGGCFWCTEAVFKMLRGVVSVTSGYAGGAKENPTYEEVTSGKTGHAEVIRIEYNPEEISYRDLLTVFFGSHDPTTLNRQGADVGTQYRSIVLTTSDEQEREAKKIIAEIEASHKDGGHVVTEVKSLGKFYPAEEYHRDYYTQNSGATYCQLVINPKLEKVQAQFTELLKENVK